MSLPADRRVAPGKVAVARPGRRINCWQGAEETKTPSRQLARPMIKSAPRAAVEMGRYRDGKVLKEVLARYLVRPVFTWSHPESD